MKKIMNKIVAKVELYANADRVSYSCTVVAYALTTEKGLQQIADWVNYHTEDKMNLEVDTCTVWDDVAFVNYYRDEDGDYWQADIRLLSRENVEVEDYWRGWDFDVEVIDSEDWL